MPATITPSIRSAIERLKHAGSISGIALGWRRQLLLNLTPYETFRVERLLDIQQDAREHFRRSDREVDTFWHGFDGVFMLSITHRECSLILLHTRAHEVDFLKSAALTLLDDCQLLISALFNNASEHDAGGSTEQISDDDLSPSHQETHFIPRSH
jgi:hypothetical protein